MVHTLDGSAAHLHEVLNVIYDLAERGVGVRSLAGPLQINIADEGMGTSRSFCWPCSPKWERTFTAERAACAPAVARANSCRIDRSWPTRPAKSDFARLLKARTTPSVRSLPRPASRRPHCTGTWLAIPRQPWWLETGFCAPRDRRAWTWHLTLKFELRRRSASPPTRRPGPGSRSGSMGTTRDRRHSSLGMLSPLACEQLLAARKGGGLNHERASPAPGA